MRVALFGAVMFLSACATDGLNLAPPPGVMRRALWERLGRDSGNSDGASGHGSGTQV